MFTPLVKLKHWQIFLLQIGGVILFQIFAFSSVFSVIDTGGKDPEPEEIISMMKGLFAVIPLLILYSFYFTYGWQWAIISKLKHKIPEGVKIPIKRLKVFFIFPVVYFILIFLGVFYAFSNIAADPEAFASQGDPPMWFFVAITVMFPLHLFMIFCIFHNFVFTAKTLKTVELQREVKFEDYIGEFFLVWFQIIGIWILQPRINKLYEGTNHINSNSNIIDDIDKRDQEVI